jgi:hypothetical protein
MIMHRVRVSLLNLALVAWTFPLIAETYYVRPDGNDQAEGTSPQTAFKTLLRASHVLNHGDAVVLAPGTYHDEVLLAERFSADGSEMLIAGDESGQRSGTPPGPVVIRADNAASPALDIYRFRNLRISGLTFRGPGQGLRVQRSSGVVVQRCSFEGLSRGLVLAQCQDVRVESSVFCRCTLGVFCQSSVRARLAHLTVTGASAVGILVLSSGEGAIRNSLLTGNNTNLIADEISGPAWTSDHNVLDGSTGPWGSVPVIAKVYEWASASGQDRHSVYVTPAFKDPDKYDLRPAVTVTWAGGLPGARVGQALDPKVELDRDGRPLTVREGAACAGAYDYPAEPQPGAGWRRLAVNLRGQGPRQSAAVYAGDGALVRTLVADAAGVHELWWDGLDDLGQPVPPGRYQVRAITHDARLVDDGAVGDNGNPLGAYNCDNADRVASLPDGGFMVTTIYDEAGYPLRRYSASGQPIFAANLAEKDYAAIALAGEDLYGVVGAEAKARLVRIVLPGDRARMANGAEDYRPFADQEKPGAIAGLAVADGQAYVAASGLNIVRVIDLATGARKADWALPGVADLAADGQGALWAVSGKEVVALDRSGRVARRYATGLEKPQYLAVGAGRLAVVDRTAARLALLDAANGRVLRTLGKPRIPGQWTPVGPETLSDPRGCAFLGDGRLVLTEHARVRILWPEAGRISADIVSNFMDVAVVHPTRPEYLYCWPGVFRVDPKTGAWAWLVEAPQGMTTPPDKEGKVKTYSYGSPSTTVVLDGRPFIAYATGDEQLFMFDVSDPLRPRLAMRPSAAQKVLRLVPYSILSFAKGGDIMANGDSYGLSFARIAYKGLNASGDPIYDFAHPVKLGVAKDPSPRGMKCINAPSCDRVTGDIYYLAVTELNQKMVPGWGADGTGVGKSTPEGKPLWFAASSGGNYQSGAVIDDGKNAWYFAGKSFGGQIDLFDADGLRVTTGNWGWPCNHSIGFVDLRYGVQPYLRPDGKIGAYVEDDAIGRFARCRLDGAETVNKFRTDFDWTAAGAAAGGPSDAHRAGGKGLQQSLLLRKIAPLKVDGDWNAWAKAGVVPQIVSLPIPSFPRNWPEGLWQTFRAGTAIGAVAHDGKNLYAYFLVADDTMHFDSQSPGRMWEFDSVELWAEEEQIGLGFVASGKPALFKYRFHNREGKEWSANYALPDDGIWGVQLADLATHPLGRQLAGFTGVSLAGRSGYALMARIPFEEIKLVGGVAGRKGGEISSLTGSPGEILRLAVAFGGISAWGREQDFKVNWPSALMYSDPTRSMPFVFGQ